MHLAPLRRTTGFTLVELLIALAILGEISAFAIPKIINSSQNGSFNAKTKEAMSMVESAYMNYQIDTGASSSTKLTDLTPYMNYVKLDTTSTIDQVPTLSSLACTSTEVCIILHNGGVLSTEGYSFGGQSATNALRFSFDPDGKYSGTTNGPGKSVQFTMYFSGRITTRGNADANSTSSGATWGSVPSYDPSWFSW